MNKLDMAHDFAMKLVGNPATPLETMESIVDVSWKYADAMQAESDKRNKPEIHLVSIDTEVNGNKMTLEFIHTDMKAAAKAIQDLFGDKQ